MSADQPTSGQAQSYQETYPSYTGGEPTCPKCLNVGASTRYMQYGRCSHVNGRTEAVGPFVNERLHRECSNCGYAWDEAIR